MATPKNQIDINLPEPLYQALVAYQEQHGLESASSAILSILNEVLQPGEPTLAYATLEQVEALEAKVAYLTELVTNLSETIATSAKAAPIKTTTANNPNPITNKPQQKASPSYRPIWEDAEDEPDEILYDFLEPER